MNDKAPLAEASTHLPLAEGQGGGCTIEIDSGSGFCFGVTRAIGKAEEELAAGHELYCLGDIVHNGREVERLRQMGLTTIDHEEFARLRDANVLLRAHGEPPATYRQAEANAIHLVDATCPVVLQLQKRIKRVYEDSRTLGQGMQIVIYGKKGHAEVNGLVGQTEGTALVVEGMQDLDKIDYTRPVRLFSQTTMPVDSFRELAAIICRRMQNREDFQYRDTICRQVANRIPHLQEFSRQHDVVLFVSGKKSSNGKALFGVCHEVNPRSYFISHPEEFQPEMVEGAKTVGICGATSTPKWQMEALSKTIQEIFSKK